MSEAKKEVSKEEELKLALDGNSVDWFLQSLVSIVNEGDGMQVGITLVVAGSIVSGKLVSGRKYFETFADEFSSSFNGESKDAIRKAFAGYGDIYKKDENEESDRPPPQFLHLIDSRCFFPGSQVPNNRGVLWRGKINAVSGFSLGHLTAGQAEEP